VLPPFMTHRPVPTRLHTRLTAGVGRVFEGLSARRGTLLILPVGLVVLCAVGLPRLEWRDDLAALNALDPTLRAEDERVRERVARVDAGRFVVAIGQDLDEALARNDEVAAVLEAAITDGLVARIRTLHTYLWSPSLQARNIEAVAALDAWPRTERALAAEGFETFLFEPFREALEDPPPPLTFDTLRDTALGPVVRQHVIPVGERVAVLTYLSGVAEPDALKTRVESVEGVRWFDQRQLFQDTYRQFRTDTTELLLFGLVAVFALVFARYRRLGASLAAFLPSVGAAAGSLAVLGIIGVEANLLHVVALLLVLSMGVDYGIFVVESETHPEGVRPTIVSLLVACVSTLLSFGMLAASEQPALRALGMTVAIGVGLSLVLAPAAWLLLQRRPPGPPPG
jgi:predicted exporter